MRDTRNHTATWDRSPLTELHLLFTVGVEPPGLTLSETPPTDLDRPSAVWLRCEEHLTRTSKREKINVEETRRKQIRLSDTEEELPKTGPTGTRPGWGDHQDPPPGWGNNPDPGGPGQGGGTTRTPRDPARVGGPPGPPGTRPGWGDHPDPGGPHKGHLGGVESY
ncbi:unnamed protein product [Arctogadus glacialis]